MTWWQETFDTRVGLGDYLSAGYETLYMVFVSLFVGTLIGIPLALALVLYRPGGLLKNTVLYNVVNAVVNLVRSLPFIILMVAIIPFTPPAGRHINWHDSRVSSIDAVHRTVYRQAHRIRPLRRRSRHR